VNLTKEQILAATDRRTVEIEVPELGGTVHLRQMGALDYHHSRKRHAGVDWDDAVCVTYYALSFLQGCWLDPATGGLMFGPDELDRIGSIGPEVIDRLFAAALELHGVRAQAAEDTEKNCGPTQPGDGGIDSPGSSDTRPPSTCGRS
jgi:hypothetical protein